MSKNDLEILNTQISDQIEGRIRKTIKMKKVFKGLTEPEIEVSIFNQNGKYFAESDWGLSAQITRDQYQELLRMEEYFGNSWQFQSQYTNLYGMEWEKLEKYQE